MSYMLSFAIAVLAAAPLSLVAPVQAAHAQSAAPLSSLRVSGTAGQISCEAEHADVASTLRMVFDQADRQFSLDNTVAGAVTLRVENQPLRTVLDAICRETLLRYDVDVAGIFRFTRDDAAVKLTIARIAQLNAAMRAQLQALGVIIPPGWRDRSAIQAGVAGSVAVPPGAARLQSLPQPFGGAGGLAARSLEQSGNVLGGAVVMPQAKAATRLLSVRVPKNTPEPVTDVLLKLAQQAGVPLIVDPGVPRGLQFRFVGNLTASTLAEALDLLAPRARLQWFWVGNSIIVTTAPDFEVYYGTQTGVHKTLPEAGPRGTARPSGRPE